MTEDDAASDAKLDEAVALHRHGRLDEARVLYETVLRTRPRCLRAVRLLAGIFMQTGRADLALDLLNRALHTDPDDGGLHLLCGAAQLELAHYQAAVASYDKALAVDPRNPWAYTHRGIALFELGRHAEAVASHDRALALAPDHADAYYNRGNALRGLKKWQAAVDSYDAAISRESNHKSAYLNRGTTLLELKRPLEAIESYDRAIAIDPRDAQAHSNRGAALLRVGQPAAALESFDRVIALEPEWGDAHFNRGNALREMKQYSSAVESYDRALARGSRAVGLLGLRLNSKTQICDWRELDAGIDALVAAIEAGQPVSDPFFVLSLVDSARVQRQAAEAWVKALPASHAAASLRKRRGRRKIRIGYFSHDFRDHPVAILSAGLFECHDRSAFDVIAFALGPPAAAATAANGPPLEGTPGVPASRAAARRDAAPQDAMRLRLERAFDRFIELGAVSDADSARLARDMEIDIAVDLGGYTAGARPGIFTARAAPLQVGWLGYTGTSGAYYMDYLIADHTIIPAERRCEYTEKIVYLPHSFQVNDGERAMSDRAMTRAEWDLPAIGFVFCCFNTPSKILPVSFDGWMRILARVSDSVLWLLGEDPLATRNLRREAAARGVSGDRLIFGRRIPAAEHLVRHRCADLFLDSLPFNAHSTASDALWAGLPVVTRLGEAMAGRVAASLLRALNLPELITTTVDQFEDLAVDLATNLERLERIKRTLAANRLTQPLFDTRRFARDIETAYRRIIERYDGGLAPDHIGIRGE